MFDSRLFASLLTTYVLVIGAEDFTGCSHPDVPENGHAVFATTGPTWPPGTIVKYECDAGFLRLGPAQRECQRNSTWGERAPVCAVNVGLYKPAYQSSTVQGANGLWLNGNLSTDGDFQGSCSRTQDELSPHWEVDLLQSYRVYAVEILFQDTSLTTLEIYVGSRKGGENRQLCYRYASALAPSAVHSFICEEELLGRYVRIAGNVGNDKKTSLGICEVTVLSKHAGSAWLCPSIPNMETWDLFSGYCYHGSQETQPWFHAGAHCRLNAASLLADISLSENKYIVGQLNNRAKSQQTQYYWTGLTNTRNGDWRWISGEPLTESFWAADSNGGRISTSDVAYAGAMARAADWAWIPAIQAVWSHWICKSRPAYCATPGVPYHGGVMISSQRSAIGSVAYYYCDYGYYLRGPDKRLCLDNATWAEFIPECHPIDCGEIEAISGGEVLAVNQSSLLDAVLEYKCQYGMKLIGNPVRKCLSNGVWSGTIPICKVIDCGWPENGTHMIVSLTENATKIGSIAEYSCAPGFTLLGSNLRHCSPGGKWVPQAPICYDSSTLKATFVNKEATETTSSGQNTNMMTGFLVAVAILVLIVIGLVVWFWRRKKQYSNLSSFYGSVSPGVIANSDILYAYTNGGAIGASQENVYYSSTGQMPNGPQLLPNGFLATPLMLSSESKFDFTTADGHPVYLAQPQLPSEHVEQMRRKMALAARRTVTCASMPPQMLEQLKNQRDSMPIGNRFSPEEARHLSMLYSPEVLRITAAGATLPRKVAKPPVRRPVFLIPPTVRRSSSDEQKSSPSEPIGRPKWFDTISKRIGAAVQKATGEQPDRPARKPRISSVDISLPSVITSTYRQPVVDTNTNKLSAAELLKTSYNVAADGQTGELERCGTPDSELFAFDSSDSDDETITDGNSSGVYAVPDEILRKSEINGSLMGRNTGATSSYDSNYVSGASSQTQSSSKPDEPEIYDRVPDDRNSAEEPIYKRLKNKVSLGSSTIEQDFTVC